MSEQTVSASADDAKAETKFEKQWREFHALKLEARAAQSALSRREADVVECDGELQADKRAIEGQHTLAVAEADEARKISLGLAHRAHATTNRELKAAEEAYATALKRVVRKQDSLREQFDSEMRNQ